MHATRGRILDRDGRPLAVSTPVRSLCIDASGIDEPISRQQTDTLAHLLDVDPADIARIYAAKRGFAYLKRDVPVDVAERAMRLDVPSLFAQDDFRRFYPEGEIAAQITGLTGVDGSGQKGLELSPTADCAAPTDIGACCAMRAARSSTPST